MLKAYSKFLDILEKICMGIMGVLMFLMVTAMVYQVILRYIFNDSNIWSEEITRYMFVYVVLLGSFVAVRRNKHLQVDFLINMFKGNFKRYFTLVTDFVVLGFLVYLLPLSYNLALDTMVSISPGLNLPMGVVYGAVPIGTFLMILGMIEIILEKITNKTKEGEN